MDAVIFPHEFMIILNPQNKTGTASFVACLVKNACTVFVLYHHMYGPFLFLFQASWYVQYSFLKGKIMLIKLITFQNCIFKKTQRLTQRTSIVHLVGDFPLKIIRNFKKYYFLTGIQLEIKKKKIFQPASSKCKYSTGKGNTLTSITLLLPKEKRQKTST